MRKQINTYRKLLGCTDTYSYACNTYAYRVHAYEIGHHQTQEFTQ